MSDLIDTTEMYLRTIFELEEEGIVPLRARSAQRLGQSGPTVSQTVARMARDGLVEVSGDRHLELTDSGRQKATRVMRKHRLAERLLTDIIGLEWEFVHEEACRWEHVMSDRVERKILALLDHPTESPYGNPIPGLAELGESALPAAFLGSDLQTLRRAALAEPRTVVVRRIGEPAQQLSAELAALDEAGLLPGREITVFLVDDEVVVARPEGRLTIAADIADHILVGPVAPA
ncbi:MAG: iron dependent repressor, metal binding and dimerization domain protein [Angustibacter sp.]